MDGLFELADEMLRRRRLDGEPPSAKPSAAIRGGLVAGIQLTLAYSQALRLDYLPRVRLSDRIPPRRDRTARLVKGSRRIPLH